MKRDNLPLGRWGEDLAAAFLLEKGFRILHRNWRWKRLELDIVASRNGILHIVEVKSRKNQIGGFPESRVTMQKFRHLQAAGDMYREQNPGWTKIQYDILSVIGDGIHDPAELMMIEDVYYW